MPTSKEAMNIFIKHLMKLTKVIIASSQRKLIIVIVLVLAIQCTVKLS